ncbi:MAG TPA: hypothetical protein VFY82_11175 [Acidimicrobiales bacterium]|nr:hypothetical protein [Acidimicrobiales bacterium]
MSEVDPRVIGRRGFLVSAGSGALGVTILGMAACTGDDEPDDADGEQQATDARGPGTDPRYSLGLPTAELLARANLAAPTGVDDGSRGNGYWVGSPTASTTWDMRSFAASGHFDCDATSPDTYPTGRYNRPRAPTEHQRNARPIRLGHTTPAAEPAIIGGKVTGDQSTTLGWTDLKHGSYIQGLIDEGMDPDRAYDEIVDNTNMDGDPRLYFASGSWAVVDGLRCRNTWDGFGVYGDGSRTATGTIYIRNSWFSTNRDDGIENDEQRQLHLFDCLFEDAHTLLSTRAEDEDGSPAEANTQNVEDCVVKLTSAPGGHKRPSDVSTSGYIYKMQDNSPYLVMRNTVVSTVGDFSSDEGPMLPERSGDHYDNVTICWLSGETYPGNTPAGVTVRTGAAAQTLIDDAVARWKRRHGVTDFDNVDMARMLAPAALRSD